MNINDFLKSFNGTYVVSDFGYALSSPGVWNLVKFAVMLAFILFVVSIIIEMYKYVCENGGNYGNIIMRIFVISMVLNFYGPMIQGSLNFTNYVVSKMGIGSDLQNTFDRVIQIEEDNNNRNDSDSDALQGKKNTKPQKKSWWPKISIKLPDLNPTHILMIIMLFITKSIFWFIIAVRNVALTMLIIAGPIAIATYANPLVQKFGSGWVMSFINVMSWPIWMAIIFKIQTGLYQLAFAGGNIDVISIFAYSLVLIYFLLKVMTFLPEMISGKAGVASPLMAMIGAAATRYISQKVSTVSNATKGLVSQMAGNLWEGSKQHPTLGDAMPFNRVGSRALEPPPSPPGFENIPKITQVL